jgi:hypothetical protein
MARTFTNFTKSDLYRIHACFGMPPYVQVPKGAFHCTFTSEELVLFLLIKHKGDYYNSQMADAIMGGDESWWGCGYKFMLRYLDSRYVRVIGNRSMERWINDFPHFAERIRQKLARPYKKVNPRTGQTTVHQGIHFAPGDFAIAWFIDCNITKTCVVWSGPDGDYDGAQRREGWYYAQRSIYTGWKKCHGVKVLTVMLPNGLTATIYGPCSVRP